MTRMIVKGIAAIGKMVITTEAECQSFLSRSVGKEEFQPAQ
jgi:hypothetical protein